VTAASGIEIALRDAAGKLLGVPVYQLLGGKYRDEVRTHADCHAGAAPSMADGTQEYHALGIDWFDDLLPRSDPPVSGGTIAVPDAPGLGSELDESAVAAHLAEGEAGFE